VRYAGVKAKKAGDGGAIDENIKKTARATKTKPRAKKNGPRGRGRNV
jgi:hypothetical protein